MKMKILVPVILSSLSAFSALAAQPTYYCTYRFLPDGYEQMDAYVQATPTEGSYRLVSFQATPAGFQARGLAEASDVNASKADNVLVISSSAENLSLSIDLTTLAGTFSARKYPVAPNSATNPIETYSVSCNTTGFSFNDGAGE